MNELNNSTKSAIKKIREITDELIHSKNVKISELAYYLQLDERRHSSFYKFLRGGHFPKFLYPIIGKILEKLNKLVENPDLLMPKQIWEEENSGYDAKQISRWVWIPFDLKLPIADYDGNKPPLSVITMGTKKGIIAFRNTSKYDADGELYIDHIGMATGIEPGTKIAIKRIDKTDWRPDRYYLIIDASGQISIWELRPGEDKKTVRYVSTSSPEGPHMELPLERIVAIFSLVDGTCIPKPKRNSVTASTPQQ
jgi:hypothetical protein